MRCHLQDIRKQLLTIMDRYKLELGSAGRDYVRICKAITSGYFFHAARKDAQDGYKSIVRLCSLPTMCDHVFRAAVVPLPAL